MAVRPIKYHNGNQWTVVGTDTQRNELYARARRNDMHGDYTPKHSTLAPEGQK